MRKTGLVFVCLMCVLLLASCAEKDATGIPSEIEIVNIPTDRDIYSDLQQVEANSTIIVEAVAKENLGQDVSTHFDNELQKDLPDYGYTRWEIEVTKVYKGDVKVGDKVVLLQDYYIWTYPDGKQQLVTFTSLKPVVKNNKYLLFLVYDHNLQGYCAVGDYEGMFAIPTKEIKEKTKAGELEQSDFEVYNYETLHYLIPIYNEVAQKYFN
ncbi:MAG TPA: hypothetical protein VF260_05230 [Bacilli bacterium]